MKKSLKDALIEEQSARAIEHMVERVSHYNQLRKMYGDRTPVKKPE
jgi:hypothetical protein